MSVVETVTANVSASMAFTEQLTLGPTAASLTNVNCVPNVPGGSSPTYAFTNGTSTGGTVAGVIDYDFIQTYTLASSASTTLVLSALTDTLNRSVAFVRVRVLLI